MLHAMDQSRIASSWLVSASYAVLRREGRPPPRARVELGLAQPMAAKLERLFLARNAGGPQTQRPRFARHAAHVGAVLAAGGYPSLERP
jgi:hypothetical protein